MEDIFKDVEDIPVNFMNSPDVRNNIILLQNIGILDYIESLTSEIHNYKSLLTRGLDIFNHTSIDEIMDSTVYQISDHFLPSFIAFLWKPIQTKEDIAIKAYKNYKSVNLDIHINSITPFEAFFRQNPKPINLDLLASKLNNDEAIKPYMEINTEILVPVLGPLGLYGIILIGRRILEDEYSAEEIFLLQNLMCFVSQAIRNHLHYEHSLRDVKTGLYNHGFFLTRLKEEVVRIKRNQNYSSIIVMDVDKFKNFNDEYGHLAGDKVLEDIAHTIKQSVRGDDIPSRFGGEEFTVLLPNTDKTTVWVVAERIRNNIANMTVSWEVQLPQVTISLGIYTFDQNASPDVNDIIRRADEALYISKERGRNRCTLWNPGIIDPHPGDSCSIEKLPDAVQEDL